jgi:hypothetical protein
VLKSANSALVFFFFFFFSSSSSPPATHRLFLRNATLSRNGEVAPGVTLPPPPPAATTHAATLDKPVDPTYQALPVLSEPAKPRRAAPDAAAAAPPPPAVVLPPAPTVVVLPPQPQAAQPTPQQQARPDVHYESLPRKASLPPPAVATDDDHAANNGSTGGGGSNSNSGRSPKEEETFQSIQPASTASLTYVELPGEDEIKAARIADRPPAALPPGVPAAGGALPPMPMAPATAAFKAPMLVRRSVVDDSAASAAAAAAAEEMSEALKSPKSNANAMLLRSSSSATNLVHNNAATANNAHGRASTAAPPPSALARKSSTNEPFEVRLQRLITSESFWAPNVTSRSMARTQLQTLGVGSFLVRPSSSEIANSFALSHHDRAHGVGHLLLCCHEEANGSVSYSICPDRNKEPTSPTVLGMLQNLGFPDSCRCGWELEGPAPAASSSSAVAAASGSGASHAMMLSHAVSSPMLMHQQRTSSVGGAQARTSLAQLAASIPSVPLTSPKPHDNDSGGSIDAGLEDLHPGAGVEWQPDADRPAAEEWLRTREPGSYLVRPSKGRPGCLTVSCKEKPSGKIVHASIFRGADGKWHTEAKQTLRWATVRELLRALPYNLIVEDIYVPLASVSDQGIVISPRTSTTLSQPAAAATMAIPAQPTAAAVAGDVATDAERQQPVSHADRPGGAARRSESLDDVEAAAHVGRVGAGRAARRVKRHREGRRTATECARVRSGVGRHRRRPRVALSDAADRR